MAIPVRSWLAGVGGMFVGCLLFATDTAVELLDWGPDNLHFWIECVEFTLIGPGLGVTSLLLAERLRSVRDQHEIQKRAERERRLLVLGRMAAAVAHEDGEEQPVGGLRKTRGAKPYGIVPRGFPDLSPTGGVERLVRRPWLTSLHCQQAVVRKQLDESSRNANDLSNEQGDLKADLRQVDDEDKRLGAEVESLRTRTSRIGRDRIDMRQRLSDALQISADRLAVHFANRSLVTFPDLIRRACRSVIPSSRARSDELIELTVAHHCPWSTLPWESE